VSTDAARLAAAFNGAPPLSGLEQPPATVADAYALQDAVCAELGRPIVGWKVAHTVEKAQEAAGINAPTVAPLLEGMIVPSEMAFAAGSFRQPIVEAEIVLELGRTIEGPKRREELIEAVRGLRIGIEVADTRFLDKDAMGTLAQIGDMNAGGALVIGPLLEINTLSEALDNVPTMRLGDGTMTEPLPRDMRPNPITVLAFLADFLAGRGKTLAAGTLITTGTHTVPTRSGPGKITARFGDAMRVGARLGSPRTP